MSARVVFIMLFAWSLVPGRAGATVHVAAEWSQLVEAAGVIVHGRIVAVQPRVAAGRRRVETLVTLEASTYLKGHWGSRVTFVVPGGRIGRYRTVVLDAPAFAAGEEVVLMLAAAGPSMPHVLGLSQGVFRVRADPASGEPRVSPAPLLGAGPGWSAVERGDPSRRQLTLAEFASQVQTVLEGPQ